MIDISKLDGELISCLASLYTLICLRFDKNPLEADPKKQRKIRKWISGDYIDLMYALPKEADIFSPKHSDSEVLLALKECFDIEQGLIEKRKDRFDNDCTALDEASKSALEQLLKLDIWPEIKFIENDIQIEVDSTPAFRRILTLKNADAVPQNRQGHFCQNLGIILKREENRFCFYGELEDPQTEVALPFGLTFENAEVKVEVYNACNYLTFWEQPWDLLRSICFSIGMKADIPGEYCNPLEKALLPIIKEIVSLEYWMELPEQERLSFAELKKLTAKYGYEKATLLLSELETITPGEYKFNLTAKKLINLLCGQKYEPLWREIYNKIVDSQAEYPNKVDSLCDKDLLAGVRRDIQALMEANGYSGTYPNFSKYGELKGVHLERSYNMSYFVGMEKRVEYHIKCLEAYQENDNLIIQFLCGTAFLKNNEPQTDVYACLFNANGRRLYHTMHHYIPENPEDLVPNNLETSVTIAVKKAECKRLTKAEKKEYCGSASAGFGTFFEIFLVCGGLFGISMTLIAMLLCVIVTAATTSFSDVPEMLKSMPWGLLLAIGWIGFGGCFGISEVISINK